MRIRLYNARILSMTSSKKFFEGEIWVKDNLIEYIGGKVVTENETFDREINIHHNLIMPGFKNAHAHSAMTFGRGYADGLPLNIWLHQKIFPLEAKLRFEHVYWFTLLAYMEYLSSGITANFDMYYEPEAIIKASCESGMKTVLCGAINDFKESIDLLEKYFVEYNKRDELISYILGFHAEYTTSSSVIQKISDLADKYKAPVYSHNSETKNEVKECIKRYGVTPTKLFYENGIYKYGGGGFHCIYLNDEDIEIFQKNNLNIVINSCSNMKLSSGIAPAIKYHKKGIRLAIGTDGASSNDALDMFREMCVTALCQKILNNDLIDPFDILKMAVVNGAYAMGLDNCSSLDKGKSADLVVINTNMPNLQPENDIISSLVYSGGKQNVCMTMINGKILYENGEYNTIDSEKIIHNANKLLKQLTK